jgi:hypothetical protein
MKYHEVFPVDRNGLERLRDSGNEAAIIDALLSAAFYEPEWRWVQSTCLGFLDHPAKGVRWKAATCLGQIARIHQKFDVEVVVPRLLALRSDTEIGNNVDDALDDIKWYLRPQ